MTLTELRYIVALQQTAHFGKAAEKCFVSQPTLSVAIKKLEDELDVSLFERSRNQVRATPLGEQIIQQAQHVLEQAGMIKGLAELGKDPLGTTLSIGAIFTIGPYLFPHLVPKLQSAAPNMPLYIEENYTAVLREKLRNGELDAIVIALPFEGTDINTLPLYDEPYVVVLPRHHPLADKTSISPKQLEKESVLLLGEGHCFREQVLEACPGLKRQLGQAGDQLHPVVEGSSLETLKYMVTSGLGITILPKSAAQLAQYNNDLLISRPLKSNHVRTVALAWRSSFPRQQALDTLGSAIRQCEIGKPQSP